jgi:Flp pilus assembly protein TadG
MGHADMLTFLTRRDETGPATAPAVEPFGAAPGDAPWRAPNRRLSRMMRRFRRDAKGATAVEFALLAFPFFFMMMMIVETSLVFWTRQVTQEAVQQASRTILTGQSRTLYTGTAAAQLAGFRDATCGLMRAVNLADCRNRLFIDVQPMASFPGGVNSMVQGGAIDPSTFAMRQPGPGEIVLVRAAYTMPVITAGFFNAMSRVGTRNAVEVTVAFRTEPFPTS